MTNLQYLRVDNNQLTSLDVAGLTNLQYLRVDNNQLTSLDVAGLTSLQTLYADNNQLTSLDATGLTNLQTLYVYDNQLASLDVAGLTNLQTLSAYNNQLTSLDATGLTNLQTLYVYDNQLTSLDVAGLTSLQTLYANNNQLASFNVTGLTSLQTLDVSGNRLKLSDMYAYMLDPTLVNLHLGNQTDVEFDVFASALSTGADYSLATESVFNGTATVFKVTRSDGSPAVEGVDYTVNAGVITFLTAGDYVVSMENDEIYSRGAMSVYDPATDSIVNADFETAANIYGIAHPLASSSTGILSILDNVSSFAVSVSEAGGSINAYSVAAGLAAGSLANAKYDGELGQIFTDATRTKDPVERLNLVNQLHIESIAGGMDAILRSAARPFILGLHNQADARLAGDGLNYAAANSWSAFAQVSGTSSYGYEGSASGLGQFASLSGHDGYLGYDVRNYGAMAGMDKLFNEGRLGIALGYSHTKVKWDDYDNKTDSDNFHAGLYASRFYDGFAFTAQANLGYADADTTRRLPAVDATATGDYHMWWYGAGLSAAHAFDLGNCLTLTPSLGLDYLHSRSSSFNEKGAGTAAALVDSQDRDQLDGRLSVELAKTFFSGRTRITPSVNAGLGYALLDRQTAVDYRFAGAPDLPAFRAESAKLDRARFTAGAALDVGISDRVSLAASYRGDFQSDYNSHFFHLGVGVRF